MQAAFTHTYIIIYHQGAVLKIKLPGQACMQFQFCGGVGINVVKPLPYNSRTEWQTTHEMNTATDSSKTEVRKKTDECRV